MLCLVPGAVKPVAGGPPGDLTASPQITRIARFSGTGNGLSIQMGWGMYAVIQSGGKQYRVAVGEIVRVERLTAEVGQDVTLAPLLIADDGGVRVGAPALGETVTARVEHHGRGDKIRIFKTRRRKHFRKHAGHRQDYTELKITAIAGQGASV